LDVFNFVRNCQSCLMSKYECHKVQTLSSGPIPHMPWEEISMDVFLESPMTLRKKNSCLVIVDHFLKVAHLIPTKDIVRCVETANLFIREIFRHHVLPKSILSDRNTKFTSHVWENIIKALGITLHIGTTYHSSTDGQYEVMNKILKDYLCHFVSRKRKN